MNKKEMLEKFLAEREKGNVKTGSSSGGDIDFVFIPREANKPATFRILPNTEEGNPIPGLIRSRHPDLPTKDGKTEKLDCPRLHDIQCPVCDVMSSFSDRLDVGAWDVRQNSWFNVLVIDHPDPEVMKKVNANPKKPFVLIAPPTTVFWLVEQELNPEVGDLTDVKTGSSVTFSRKKDGGAIDRSPARKMTPIADTDEGIEEILKARTDLTRLCKKPTDEHITKLRTASNILKDNLDSRVSHISNSAMDKLNNSVDSGETKSEEPVKEKEAESSNNSSYNKPANSPDCFSDKAIYNPDAKQCQWCEHEVACKAAIESSNG